MNFLSYLETTAFSEWVRVSMLGFPTLIALHSVGMAVAVGLSFMVTLHLTRILTGLQEHLILRLLDLAIWGFVLNLVTGLAIFVSRGSEYIAKEIFVVKILLVLIGTITLFRLRQRLKSEELNTAVPVANAITKTMSLVATATWFGAVVAGRLIAYISDLY